MVNLLVKITLWLIPGYLARNGISEEMLKCFFSHRLNIKYLLFNWFLENIGDRGRQKAINRYNLLMMLPRDGTYDDELAYVEGLPTELPMYPYECVKGELNVKSGELYSMPFVWHGDRKLFFPKKFDQSRAEAYYKTFVGKEGILGTGHLRKHPHSYVTETFKVEKGDVLLDVGSGDGLFALDNLDASSKVYVFESMKSWKAPLAATFAPFADKVSIVNKYVSGEVSHTSTTLDEVLKDEPADTIYFIKMDIEGAEREVIRASELFLKNHRIKIACAAYHRHDDAKFLKAELERLGFKTEFSDGYILTSANDFIYPYFRRGMIYAKNY